ncbi:MAG: alpha/beta hydrolase [Phycisphaerae bacterium]
MAKARLNGINVHYQVRGEGPDVVLIHGITSTMAVWYTHVLPALAENFRVTMYDLRGHGYTELTRGGYDSANMTADLMALMDHVGIKQARLVGHSYGGAIALHAAALAPKRFAGVVISDAGIACLRHLRKIETWHGWDTYKEQLASHDIDLSKFADDADLIIRRSFQIPRQFGMRKGELRGTRRLQRLVDETDVIKEFREIAGLTEEMLATIGTPVQALYGDQSPYHGVVTRLSELLSNCYWDVITGTGHFLLLQEPDVFIARILPFLRDPRGYVAAHRAAPTGAAHGDTYVASRETPS